MMRSARPIRMLAVGLLAGGVLAAQPVAAGALADLAGHTVIATYTNTVTTENAGNRHASETHTCKVEAHFYFSTARKLFVTVTYRKCSHSSAVRNEPNADGGDLLDYSRGLTGLDENGFRFAIKDAGNALSLTNGGKGQVRVGNDGTRRQTTGTYKAAFTISGTSCTFRRTQQRSIEIWTATAHYVQTISETGVGTSCRIVAGRK